MTRAVPPPDLHSQFESLLSVVWKGETNWNDASTPLARDLRQLISRFREAEPKLFAHALREDGDIISLRVA